MISCEVMVKTVNQNLTLHIKFTEEHSTANVIKVCSV